MTMSAAEVLSFMEQKGCRGRALPAGCVSELEKEIAYRIEQGVIHDSLQDRYLSRFSYNPEEELPGAQSVIIAAVPLAATEVAFEWDGEVISFVIPPVYVFNQLAVLSRSFREMIVDRGYRVGNCRLPYKLLAARSGLGEYGRNNILYVPGMGSYIGLIGFYTDLPPIHGLQDARLMENCSHCTLCVESCPTGSIGKESFIIRAERCLALYNEVEGEIPEWIKPSWHNALVGCMLCQQSCPENQSLADRLLTGEQFTASETRSLLDGAAVEGDLKEKLNHICMTGYESTLARNLRLLLNRNRG